MTSYQLGLLTKMLILAIFAMSLNLILGYAGLPSLGHAAYFGVAAYTVGLLALRKVDNFWLDFGAAFSPPPSPPACSACSRCAPAVPTC